MKICNDLSDKVELGNLLVIVYNNLQKLVYIEYSLSEEDQRRLGVNGIFGDFIVRLVNNMLIQEVCGLWYFG